MDNNNFPNNQNNQNNSPFNQPQNNNPFNTQPQGGNQPQQASPFSAQPQGGNQPQQASPFNAQPQNNNPFGNQPPQNNSPFGGHNHNTQPNNPFMSQVDNKINNMIPGGVDDHKKGVISTVCGLGSLLLNIISMLAMCVCAGNITNSGWSGYSNAVSGYQASVVVGTIMAVIALAAAIVGIVMAAQGMKSPNRDSLATAGLVLSIIALVFVLISFVSCLCHCTACVGFNSSDYSTINSILNSYS